MERDDKLSNKRILSCFFDREDVVKVPGRRILARSRSKSKRMFRLDLTVVRDNFEASQRVPIALSMAARAAGDSGIFDSWMRASVTIQAAARAVDSADLEPPVSSLCRRFARKSA